MKRISPGKIISETIQTHIEEHDTFLDMMFRNLLRSEIGRTNEENRAYINKRIGDVEAGLVGVEGQVRAVNEKVGNLETKVDSLEAKVGSLEKKMQRNTDLILQAISDLFNKMVTKLEHELLKERMDELEEKVNSI